MGRPLPPRGRAEQRQRKGGAWELPGFVVPAPTPHPSPRITIISRGSDPRSAPQSLSTCAETQQLCPHRGSAPPPPFSVAVGGCRGLPGPPTAVESLVQDGRRSKRFARTGLGSLLLPGALPSANPTFAFRSAITFPAAGGVYRRSVTHTEHTKAAGGASDKRQPGSAALRFIPRSVVDFCLRLTGRSPSPSHAWVGPNARQ